MYAAAIDLNSGYTVMPVASLYESNTWQIQILSAAVRYRRPPQPAALMQQYLATPRTTPLKPSCTPLALQEIAQRHAGEHAAKVCLLAEAAAKLVLARQAVDRQLSRHKKSGQIYIQNSHLWHHRGPRGNMRVSVLAQVAHNLICRQATRQGPDNALPRKDTHK